jgi:hypothetical protein
MKLMSRGFSLNWWFSPIGENTTSVENAYSILVIMVFECLLFSFRLKERKMGMIYRMNGL